MFLHGTFEHRTLKASWDTFVTVISKRSLHLIYTCILNISNRRDWWFVVIIKLILQLSRGNEQLACWAISERRHSKVCINLTKLMRMPQGDWPKGHLTWLITKLTIVTCYCSVLIMKCFGLEYKFTLNCIQICEDTFDVNLINGHNPFHASERTLKGILSYYQRYEQFPLNYIIVAISETQKKITNSLWKKMWHHLPPQRPEMREKLVI